MQTFQRPCEKASFSDFARYCAYTRTVKRDIPRYPEVRNSLLVNLVQNYRNRLIFAKVITKKLAHFIDRSVDE